MDGPIIASALVSKREDVALRVRFRVLLALSDACRVHVFLEGYRQFFPDYDLGGLGVDDDVWSLEGVDAGARGKDSSDRDVIHEEDPVVGQVEYTGPATRGLVDVGFGARLYKGLSMGGRP
jgi:hypothetical protein